MPEQKFDRNVVQTCLQTTNPTNYNVTSVFAKFISEVLGTVHGFNGLTGLWNFFAST
jgi:hypothetical protein